MVKKYIIIYYIIYCQTFILSHCIGNSWSQSKDPDFFPLLSQATIYNLISWEKISTWYGLPLNTPFYWHSGSGIKLLEFHIHYLQNLNMFSTIIPDQDLRQITYFGIKVKLSLLPCQFMEGKKLFLSKNYTFRRHMIILETGDTSNLYI